MLLPDRLKRQKSGYPATPQACIWSSSCSCYPYYRSGEPALRFAVGLTPRVFFSRCPWHQYFTGIQRKRTRPRCLVAQPAGCVATLTETTVGTLATRGAAPPSYYYYHRQAVELLVLAIFGHVEKGDACVGSSRSRGASADDYGQEAVCMHRHACACECSHDWAFCGVTVKSVSGEPKSLGHRDRV